MPGRGIHFKMALGLFGAGPCPKKQDYLSELNPDALLCISSFLDDIDVAMAACAQPRLSEFRRDQPMLRNALALYRMCCEAAEDHDADIRAIAKAMKYAGLDGRYASFEADELPGAKNKRPLKGSIVEYVWCGSAQPGSESGTAYPTVEFKGAHDSIALIAKLFEVHSGSQVSVVMMWRSRTMVALLKYRSTGSVVSHVKQIRENLKEAARFVELLEEIAPFVGEVRWLVGGRKETMRTTKALCKRSRIVVLPENTPCLREHPFLA